jgi:KDO2-lipid IV(A) lauroyltransferase
MKTDPASAALGHPRYWMSWFGLAMLRVISLMPLPLLWLLGGALGGALYYLHAPRRHIVLRNVGSCFPGIGQAAQRRMARRHFRGLGQAALSSGIAYWASRRRLERLFHCTGYEHYTRALAQQRPVILLTAHFFGVEMGGIFLSRAHPMADMYRRMKNRLYDEVFRRGRTRFGGMVVERQEGLKPVIRAMRQGVTFYYLPDQDPGRHNTAFIPFFGVPAATLTALGRLARVTNAIVVPCFTRQLPYGAGYEVMFKPALENFPTDDEIADATRMNRVIEDAVREMPEQYFWVHKRFKTRPEGEPDFYRGK